ncbi:MAG: hypothetical protein HY898_17890 [Deltaproteobacteria bacterium]|nr:hypothetical protein [Deltaproteobacteria bacterium]
MYKLVADLEQLAMDNPIQAREALAESFKDGCIAIECLPGRTVVGRSKFLPLVAFDRAQNAKPRKPSGTGALTVYRGGCAGRI